MLNKIKLLLGLTSNTKDELLNVLIESAIEEAKTITNNNDTAGMENCICSMVCYKYNLLGSEGLNSESYSGVSFNYSTDYPENIVKQLKKHRILKVW